MNSAAKLMSKFKANFVYMYVQLSEKKKKNEIGANRII
jgi:hypothetical protein